MNQLYIYMYPLPFGFPSYSGHHSTLKVEFPKKIKNKSRIPCAIQQILISYLFYT